MSFCEQRWGQKDAFLQRSHAVFPNHPYTKNMSSNVDINARPERDEELLNIADYVSSNNDFGDDTLNTARYCLMDALGCAFLALRFPDCTNLLGPIVENQITSGGARVPGTSLRLDPVKAAWDIGCTIRWLDYNDTWLAAEWGHPSDNIGAILACADYLSQRLEHQDKRALTMRDVLVAMVKAHEIQGVIALLNSFNRVGLDHVLLVKVASTAVATHMFGGSRDQIADAVSQAFVDGHSLRTYRHAPNAGSRKSWAAGDATARGVFLAMLTMKGEMGYPSVLTAPRWGFYDTLFKGGNFKFDRVLEHYVMDNVLFKISFPAEFHAQTAVEAAIKLHPQVIGKLDEIERIELTTHESAIRIISKVGPLNNYADRDHCLQYMVAIGLLKGDLTADDYSDTAAADPRIDQLREKMEVVEDKRYSADYLHSDKRSIGNAVQIFFRNGSETDKVVVEYPLGHRRRREEGIPKLVDKFRNNLDSRFPVDQADRVFDLMQDHQRLMSTTAHEFMDMVQL